MNVCVAATMCVVCESIQQQWFLSLMLHLDSVTRCNLFSIGLRWWSSRELVSSTHTKTPCPPLSGIRRFLRHWDLQREQMEPFLCSPAELSLVLISCCPLPRHSLCWFCINKLVLARPLEQQLIVRGGAACFYFFFLHFIFSLQLFHEAENVGRGEPRADGRILISYDSLIINGIC